MSDRLTAIEEDFEDFSRILDELEIGPVITPNMTDREVEISWFLWGHEQNEIEDAQLEQLTYLWGGGLLQ